MPVPAFLELALALGAAAAQEQAGQWGDPDGHPDSHAMTMNTGGALGDYPMSRDSSGTSWQPDATIHEMGHVMRPPVRLPLLTVMRQPDREKNDSKATL